MLKRIFKKRIQEIMKKFDDEEILKQSHKANCFGLESRGKKQVRGNGVLILTKEELFFGQYIPKRDISIPIDSITRVHASNSHLGRRSFLRLLKIEFQAENSVDSIAWQVVNLKEWLDLILDLKK
ncbi:MAG: hypothetical protein ACTSRB_18125 [Candidatus Helarchaeota archaeon]